MLALYHDSTLLENADGNFPPVRLICLEWKNHSGHFIQMAGPHKEMDFRHGSSTTASSRAAEALLDLAKS